MLNVAERPDTLSNSIQDINPNLYPQRVYCSRHTDGDVCFDSHARRSFRTVRHLKNCLRLRSTLTTEHMWGMALMQVHKETELDAERIIDQFSLQSHRRLALLFRPK